MYFLVFLIGFVFQMLDRKSLLYTYAIILLLLGAFRYGVGSDYFAYEYLFNRLANSPIAEFQNGLDHQEISFRLIGSFLKGIGFSYQLYLVVFLIINLVFVVKICEKYSKNPTLSLFLYYCFYYMTWSFSAIRQGVTTSVGIYFLLKYIEEEKPYHLIAVSLLLSLIHLSALILILFYFLLKLNLEKKQLISLLIVSVFFSMLPIGAIVSHLSWLPLYERIEPYLATSFSLNFLDFQGFARLVFLFFAFVLYDNYSKQGSLQKKVIFLYILSIILYFFLQFSELLAARMTIYGKFFEIIIFASVWDIYKERLNKRVYAIGLLMLSAMYLYKEVNVNVNGSLVEDYKIAPYTHIFNHDDYTYSSEFNEL